MTKKIFNSTTALILGIVLLVIGFTQFGAYGDALTVDATVVDVVVKDEHDVDSGYVTTSYTVYADYELNGQKYSRVRIGKYYDTNEYYVGKTVSVTVDPENPGSMMSDGGMLCVAGVVIAAAAIVCKVRKKKTA